MKTTKLELVIGFYAKRGTMENYIKESKNGFRRLTLPEDYRKMMIETLRIKLFKVAAKRVKEARRVVFKLCSHYPYKDVFLQTLKQIQNIKLE